MSSIKEEAAKQTAQIMQSLEELGIVVDLSVGKEAGLHIWTCKIGGVCGGLPSGADLPMRLAIEEAYFQITGTQAEFTFSGWGGELTASEREVLEEPTNGN